MRLRERSRRGEGAELARPGGSGTDRDERVRQRRATRRMRRDADRADECRVDRSLSVHRAILSREASSPRYSVRPDVQRDDDEHQPDERHVEHVPQAEERAASCRAASTAAPARRAPCASRTISRGVRRAGRRPQRASRRDVAPLAPRSDGGRRDLGRHQRDDGVVRRRRQRGRRAARRAGPRCAPRRPCETAPRRAGSSGCARRDSGRRSPTATPPPSTSTRPRRAR